MIRCKIMATRILTKAIRGAKEAVQEADRLKGEYEDAKKNFTSINSIAADLNRINERRALWPELLSAVSQCFPTDPPMSVSWQKTRRTCRSTSCKT